MKLKKKKIRMRKLALAEQARIARRLATLLGAGISLIEAVRFMKRPLFTRVIREISKGRPCSEAFEIVGVFDQSLVEMVKIGEQSGTLGESFARAASFLESRDNLSRKIIGAMVYPAFIACATLGIAGFLVVYIFPKIIPLVTGMGITLPLLTRILIVLSDLLIHRWLMIIGSIVVVCIVAKMLWKYSALIRRSVRWIIFSLPIIGNIARGRIMVEIFRPLGLLIEHGELVPRALTSVGKGIRNEEYRAALFTAATTVIDGENLANALSSNPSRNFRGYFPSIVTDFLEIGERTGGMASACSHIATIYEAEVEESLKRVTQIIEPALMLGMGLTVGSIALSIVMPIYAITSHLTQ